MESKLISISKKVCLLGDFAVGKTSLVRRFVYNRFDDQYLSTIGVKVSRKTVVVPRENDIVELTVMLWDLAGSQEFDNVRASYLRGAAGAVLVCDLGRGKTIDGLPSYVDELYKINPNAQITIAANKVDTIALPQLEVAHVEQMATRLNLPFFLTSAKLDAGVEDLFRQLGKLLTG